MDFDTIKDLSSKYLFQNYGRLDISFTHGEGCYLWDTDGKKYLDSVAGIAVNSLGYSHPAWVKVVEDQITKLVHVSNLYYVEQQAMLAQRLDAITPAPLTRSLFVNSGAEANEAAMKTAVKYTGRTKVLSAWNCFHGRTAAALGATAQPKYQDPFRPLISDAFDYFNYNDIEDFKSKVNHDTAAVIVEGIQGEGGVNPATEEFMRTVRDVCTDSGALMIVDEVQTGMGRTGNWWCVDRFGISPDIISMAKGLAAGMPIGAIITTDEIASCMTPGTHGTTFGGSPLVCTSACATIDIISREHLLDNVTKVGAKWMEDLKALKSTKIRDIRGTGFIMGVEMDSEETATAVRNKMRTLGVLVNVCHGKTIRIIPPLIFGMEEEKEWMDAFRQCL